MKAFKFPEQMFTFLGSFKIFRSLIHTSGTKPGTDLSIGAVVMKNISSYMSRSSIRFYFIGYLEQFSWSSTSFLV
jgi:hypothetical protein